MGLASYVLHHVVHGHDSLARYLSWIPAQKSSEVDESWWENVVAPVGIDTYTHAALAKFLPIRIDEQPDVSVLRRFPAERAVQCGMLWRGYQPFLDLVLAPTRI